LRGSLGRTPLDIDRKWSSIPDPSAPVFENSAGVDSGSGRFEFENGLHGPYRLAISGFTGNDYIQTARLNGIPIRNTVVDVPIGVASVLEVEVNPDGGEIHLRFENDVLREGTLVGALLLPDPVPAEVGFHRRDLVSPGTEGPAVIRGVPPGRYQLFVWDPLGPIADPNLAELRNRPSDAVRLVVDPGEAVFVDVTLLEGN
jgi:hypothetical protein